jgi:citrate lyase subunit beta/citryl-CoA lyase
VPVRSKLFVPGSRPELFRKALAGDADAISIDLEDSVIESRKQEARELTGELLRSLHACPGKVMIVRCNAVETPYFQADLSAIAQDTLEILNVPKVESAGTIRAAATALERAEAANGVRRPVRILANIESAKGLRMAAEIGAAHPRVCGLQLGLNDLFKSMGIERRDTGSVHAAMFAMRLAAGEAGVFAYDGAYAEIANEQGFRAEAEMSRRLGYRGKSCIHPCQVAPANEVFAPDDRDIDFARRVLQASRQARSKGLGAFTVDGEMIDLPAVRRAERVLAASGGRRDEDG